MDIEPETDEARLTAYALGELDESERPAVYTRLAEDPEGRRLVSDVRELADQLTRALKDEPEPMPALDPGRRQAILDCLSELERPRTLPFPGPRALMPMLAAAVLLAGVGLSLFFRDRISRRHEVAMNPPPAAGAPAGAVDGPDRGRVQEAGAVANQPPSPILAADTASPPQPPGAATVPLNAAVEPAGVPLAQNGNKLADALDLADKKAVMTFDAPVSGKPTLFDLDDRARENRAAPQKSGLPLAAEAEGQAATPKLSKLNEPLERFERLEQPAADVAAIIVFHDRNENTSAARGGNFGRARSTSPASPKRALAQSRATADGEDAVAQEPKSGPEMDADVPNERQFGDFAPGRPPAAVTLRRKDRVAERQPEAPGAPESLSSMSPLALKEDDRRLENEQAPQAGQAKAPDISEYRFVLAERADTARIPLSPAAQRASDDFFGVSDRDKADLAEDKERRPAAAAFALKEKAGAKQEKAQQPAEGAPPLTLSVEMADCPWNERSRLGRVVLAARPPAPGEDDRAVVAHDVSLDVTFPLDRTLSYRWFYPAVPVEAATPEGVPGKPASPAPIGAPLAAGQQIVGLVEIIPKPQGQPTEIRAKVRYRLAPGDAPAPELAATASDQRRPFDQADPSFRFATAVGAFGLASQPRLAGNLGEMEGMRGAQELKKSGEVHENAKAPRGQGILTEDAQAGDIRPTFQQALEWARASQHGEPSRLSIVQGMERKLGVDRGPSTEGPGLAVPAPAPSPPAGPQP